jgi:hypothetical protein
LPPSFHAAKIGGMDTFIKLRQHAREKRDKAINQIRAEYALTLTKIAELEQDINGAQPAKYRTVSSCIASVIPSDRTFTTVDVMTALEALDAGRVWRKRSIDNHIWRMRERGLVRRIRKARGLEPAVYARTGVETEPLPFEDMTLVEVMNAVLGQRSLRVTELTVAMLEGGYQTTMRPKALRDAVGVELRRGRFSKDERGRWSVLSGSDAG